MILAAILIFGILTLWVQWRWALATFQISLFLAAAVALFRRQIRWHPIAFLLAAAPAWGLLQIALHRSVYEWHTWDAVLNWTTNLAAFFVALQLSADARRKFLRVILIFTAVLSIVAVFTDVASPIGKIFWIFDATSNVATLGPFVYRNQYASFMEAVLPLAIAGALLDPRCRAIYTVVAATMFASVVAGGSRTGSFLCLAEILLLPVLAFRQNRIDARSLTRVLIGSVAAIGLLVGIAGWETIWNRLHEPNPYSVRAELVRSSLEMVRDRPLTGFGLGTWSDAYPAYAHFDDGNFVNQAHNDWLQWAVEGGIPFFVLLLAVFVFTIPPALRTLWGVGLIAVFLHCAIDYPMQQRPALAAFFFAMLGAIVRE